MGLKQNLIAFRRAVAVGLQVYRGAVLRPELQEESDYDREIQEIWMEFQAFKQGREQERDEELRRETARLAALGGDPQQEAAAQQSLEQVRRRAREEMRQRGREAQGKAYALEREKNRRFRLRRSWRDVWR